MSEKTSVENTENWLNEIAYHLKIRFGDVFFSYFIVFELIYNWKFIYTLFLGDASKSENVLTKASSYLLNADFVNWTLEFFNHPSPFILAILSALSMTIIYPFLQFFILSLRKRIFYYTSKKLESDYPTRLEYQRIKNEVEKNIRTISDIKRSRITDIANISNNILRKDILVKRNTISYLIVIGKEGSHFNEDDLIQLSDSNSFIAEKARLYNFQKDNLYIIVQKFSEDVFLVAQVNQEIPITEKMFNSGKDVFAGTAYGSVKYYTDEELNEALIYSGVIFFARLSPDFKYASVEWVR